MTIRTPPKHVAHLKADDLRVELLAFARYVQIDERVVDAYLTEKDNPHYMATSWADTRNFSHQHFIKGVPVPFTKCPGAEDSRCKGVCTVDLRTHEICDPDCFRS